MNVTPSDYRDLERLLRTWESFGGGPPYDFLGMVHLVKACLGNLAEHGLEADWEQVDGEELLEEAELRVLRRLLAAHSPAP